MKKIRQLDPHLVSQIAAGEVIERPVYAVKELIENAIDAGADSISVLIQESGLKKIAVIDNGEGMEIADLKESFKPHTTSKLKDADSLTKIATLGFRGEALSSIAAISRLTISSRTREAAAGESIIIKNGKFEKTIPIGMPVGTQVSVDYLFNTVPARKKFLKSKRTEFRLIVDLLTNYALSYPSIHFVLKHENKLIFDLPKTDQLQRIETLLGKESFQALLPVAYKDAYVTLSGFIAKPLLTTRTPSKQYLFVNTRHIRDKQLSLSVKTAYGTLLESAMYPVCLLHIALPYEMVDVNTHPRKEEVRFHNQTRLLETIETTIKQTLAKFDLLPQVRYEEKNDRKVTESYAGRLLKEKKSPWELSRPLAFGEEEIMQIHKVYLMVPMQDGIVLFDQHGAHERIRYEQLLASFENEVSKKQTIMLPKPKLIRLTHSENETFLEYQEVLQKIGWEIEPFKQTSYLITSVPNLFQDRDYVSLLQELLESFANVGKAQSVDVVSKKMLAYLACHSAVRAGDTLTKKQARELVMQLEKTANNATCPHGRPTRVFLDIKMLDKLFKR